MNKPPELEAAGKQEARVKKGKNARWERPHFLPQRKETHAL